MGTIPARRPRRHRQRLGRAATARVTGVNTTASQETNLTLRPLDRNLKAFLKRAIPSKLWTALRKSWEKLQLNRIEPVRRVNRWYGLDPRLHPSGFTRRKHPRRLDMDRKSQVTGKTRC
jgi:hypothetical protein